MAEFDPELVEKAARALLGQYTSVTWRDFADDARAVLSAVAPALRAEGAQIVLDAVEAVLSERDSLSGNGGRFVIAAREAVARIEGGE